MQVREPWNSAMGPWQGLGTRGLREKVVTVPCSPMHIGDGELISAAVVVGMRIVPDSRMAWPLGIIN